MEKGGRRELHEAALLVTAAHPDGGESERAEPQQRPGGQIAVVCDRGAQIPDDLKGLEQSGD